MAENKKSFVAYCDWIESFEELEDDEAGRLIKHLLRYVNDLNPEPPDKLTQMCFIPIKQQLKRDLKSWKESKEEKSIAGIKGNLSRWNPDLYKKYIDGEITLDEAQKIAEHRRTSQGDKVTSQPIANIAVNVNDTVTVTDTVNGNVSDSVNEINKTSLDVPAKVETPPPKKNKLIFQNATSEDFQPEHKEAFQIAKSFHELFVKNLTEKEAPLTNLKKSDARVWTNQIVLMLKNSEATTEQLRRVWHFLNKDEFWKTNVQSVPKLREKFSTIYLQSKKIKNEGNSNGGTGGASDAFKRRIFETLTGQVGTDKE